MGPQVTEPTRLELTPSRQLVSWMAEHELSLVFTTFQAGKIFLLGRHDTGRLAGFERTLERCMGLAADAERLHVATLYQLLRFENALAPGTVHQGCDRLYVPQLAYTTGDLDIHDVAVEDDGRVVFANTLFSCVATVSPQFSFVPIWRPPFVSRLAAEDRCHLNGLALREGRVRYVTTMSRTDVHEGWRDQRLDGGTVVDVDSGAVVCTGLSMPHSPRWHDGRLWVLDSGRGALGWVDLETGRFEPVAFCPGYARGLVFHGDFAVVGLSRPRDQATFSGLPLSDRLAREGVEPRCGLLVVDLRAGDVVHSLRVDGFVEEIYDVAVLPGVARPMALGFRTEEIRRTITVGATPLG